MANPADTDPNWMHCVVQTKKVKKKDISSGTYSTIWNDLVASGFITNFVVMLRYATLLFAVRAYTQLKHMAWWGKQSEPNAHGSLFYIHGIIIVLNKRCSCTTGIITLLFIVRCVLFVRQSFLVFALLCFVLALIHSGVRI